MASRSKKIILAHVDKGIMGDLFKIMFRLRLITLAYFSIDRFIACFLFLSIVLKHWLNCNGSIFGGGGQLTTWYEDSGL